MSNTDNKEELSLSTLFEIMRAEINKLEALVPAFIERPVPEQFEAISDILNDFEDSVEGLFELVEDAVDAAPDKESWQKYQELTKTEVQIGMGSRKKKTSAEKERIKELKQKVAAAEREAKAAKKLLEKQEKQKEKKPKKVSKKSATASSGSSSSSDAENKPKKERKRKRDGKKVAGLSSEPILGIDANGNITETLLTQRVPQDDEQLPQASS